MRTVLTCLLFLSASVPLWNSPAVAQSRKIDLKTAEGSQAVAATWRYSDVKIVEVPVQGGDGKVATTYNIEPRAQKPDFDDSAWEPVDPTTLGRRRGTGQVCFGWYRAHLTLPDGVEGKKVTFVTTVDDYGEVWVDGKIPYKEGQTGGPIVAGFNAPNVVELPDPKPGKTYVVAIFAINGPISVAPNNALFLRDTFLEIADR